MPDLTNGNGKDILGIHAVEIPLEHDALGDKRLRSKNV